MIKFNNVNFSYGKKEILKNFSLEIKDTERICLFAPSGYGKTTVLRLILGLEKPQSGTIRRTPGGAAVYHRGCLPGAGVPHHL